MRRVTNAATAKDRRANEEEGEKREDTENGKGSLKGAAGHWKKVATGQNGE